MLTDRRVNAEAYPARKDGHGRRHCRWCDEVVPKGRRTFCSDACVEELLVRTNPGHARHLVHKRDKGICGHCGFDCDAVKQLLERARRFEWRGHLVIVRNAEIRGLVGALREQFIAAGVMTYGGHTWEADHMVGVADGGGLCGLEDYRTLCLRCHRVRTAKQARARATLGVDASAVFPVD